MEEEVNEEPKKEKCKSSGRYLQVNVKLSNDKIQKINEAYKNGNKAIINLKLNEMNGKKILYLTKNQCKKLEEDFQKGKPTKITLSKAQVNKIAQEGGFLGALAAAALPVLGTIATKVLPKIGLSALGGVAEGLAKKLVGNGLYLRRKGHTAQIETDGEGLYLTPIDGTSLKKYGNGVFLVTDGTVQKGDGLLSNIPLIGPLLKMII